MMTGYVTIIILVIIITYLKESTKKTYKRKNKYKKSNKKNNNFNFKKIKKIFDNKPTVKESAYTNINYWEKDNIDLHKNNKTNGYNSLYKNNKKKPMTRKEKKEKGDMYETYVANFFKKSGYTIWEHGKEKGVKDSSIDLIVKKEQYIYFIQCKNWETWKINHKEIKATRTDIREYLKENQIFWKLIKDYKYKLLYVTPKECLTKGAYEYIKENNDIVEYQVIPIEN